LTLLQGRVSLNIDLTEVPAELSLPHNLGEARRASQEAILPFVNMGILPPAAYDVIRLAKNDRLLVSAEEWSVTLGTRCLPSSMWMDRHRDKSAESLI